MDAERISELGKTAAAKVERYLPQLEDRYARAFRAAGRRAASAFEAKAVPHIVAAGDDKEQAAWTPPDFDEILDQELTKGDWQTKAAGIHKSMIRASVGSIISDVGIRFNLKNPLVQALLESMRVRTGNAITEAAQEILRATVGKAWSEGLSIPHTAALIRDRVEGASKAWSTTWARTDMLGLVNGGSLIGASMVGATEKTWITAGDDKVRDSHADAEGQTVAIDQPFQVGGAALQFPGDPDGPDEEVYNCRCTQVYEVPGEGEVEASGEDLVASAVPSSHNDSGQMVAVVPMPDEAKAIAIDGGEPPEILHTTLAYFPDDVDQEALASLLSDFVEGRQALSGEVGGIASFSAGDEGAPMVVTPDVPGLGSLRADLIAALDASGFAYADGHDFIPHITLAYEDTGQPTPPDADRLGLPLTYEGITLCIGSDWITFAFDEPAGGTPAEGPSGQTAALPSGGDMETEATTELVAEAPEVDEAEALRAAAVKLKAEGGAARENSLGPLIPGRFTLTAAAGEQTKWRAVLLTEDEPTIDGRMIAAGATTWRDLPLSLTMLLDGPHADLTTSAPVCGRIDSITRVGMEIIGEGVFDDGPGGSEAGQEAARLVAEKMLTGISVDLAPVEIEIQVNGEPMDDQVDEMPADGEVLYVVKQGVILSASLCPAQAVTSAKIDIAASGAESWTFARTFDLDAVISTSTFEAKFAASEEKAERLGAELSEVREQLAAERRAHMALVKLVEAGS